MNKITIWSAISESGEIKHNHISNNWDNHAFPQPLKQEYTNQKSWENMNWEKKFGHLVDRKVVI